MHYRRSLSRLPCFSLPWHSHNTPGKGSRMPLELLELRRALQACRLAAASAMSGSYTKDWVWVAKPEVSPGPRLASFFPPTALTILGTLPKNLFLSGPLVYLPSLPAEMDAAQSGHSILEAASITGSGLIVASDWKSATTCSTMAAPLTNGKCVLALHSRRGLSVGDRIDSAYERALREGDVGEHCDPDESDAETDPARQQQW